MFAAVNLSRIYARRASGTGSTVTVMVITVEGEVMMAGEHKAITEGLALIFQGIARLKEAFPNRKFTIDGRLVGDVGEVVAALEYDLVLNENSEPNHDGQTSDGRRVQVKATFKDQLTFRTVPDYYLGFKFSSDGDYVEVFNGPGHVIRERYKHRKGFGTQLLSFSVSELRKLSNSIPSNDRIPKRPARTISGN